MEIQKVIDTTNKFEIAARKKYRYPFKGQATTEDLFDLKASDLDTIYKKLMEERRNYQEESLLEVKSTEKEDLENKIWIVTYVFNQKIEAAARAEKARENAIRRQKILAAMAAKEDQALEEKPLEELQAMLDELE